MKAAHACLSACSIPVSCVAFQPDSRRSNMLVPTQDTCPTASLLWCTHLAHTPRHLPHPLHAACAQCTHCVHVSGTRPTLAHSSHTVATLAGCTHTSHHTLTSLHIAHAPSVLYLPCVPYMHVPHFTLLYTLHTPWVSVTFHTGQVTMQHWKPQVNPTVRCS